jgi:hypothetical protein
MRRNFPGAPLETGARHHPHPGGRHLWAVQAITPGCSLADSAGAVAEITEAADAVAGAAGPITLQNSF